MPVETTMQATVLTKPIYTLVRHSSIVLKGRNRHLRINLFFNTHSNCRASGSAITHLPSFLRSKFGTTAVGILVGDCVYRNDEELMRDATIKTNESYYVLYEDYSPSYAESISTPPIYHDTRCPSEGRHLPNYDDAEVRGYLRPGYYEDLVLYPTIPLITKTIYLKLSFGRKAPLTLTNKCTEHADNFRHELFLVAGYKAQGIVTDRGLIYTTDEILWRDDVVSGESYKVVKTNTGYSLSAPSPAVVAQQPSSREALGANLRRISTNTSRSLHQVTSRSSTSSRERTPAMRVK